MGGGGGALSVINSHFFQFWGQCPKFQISLFCKTNQNKVFIKNVYKKGSHVGVLEIKSAVKKKKYHTKNVEIVIFETPISF